MAKFGKTFGQKKINTDSLDTTFKKTKDVEEMMDDFESKYPLFFIEMNRAQDKFVRVKNRFGKMPRRRFFETGNKVGKCVSYHTLIDTPYGKISMGKLFEEGKPFDVYAWDGEKKVVAKATAPFKKEGVHKCYRVTMSDGQWVDAADHHHILLSDGNWQTVEYLCTSFQDRLVETETSLQYTPPLEFGNKVISISPIPSQDVYDLEVGKHHNYFAGGLVHHNTYMGIAEDVAFAMGYRPWLKEDDPDYFIKEIKVPNQGLVAGETLVHSIAEKIEPQFKMLIPDFCEPVFKPGSTGVCIRIKIPFDTNGKACGSEIFLRSYDQRAATYEGIDYSWMHWDEPPSEDILKAAERGKTVTNAPSWFTMTPLKEPFIYNTFSVRAALVL
jgi:phage terminase large subunit-like protein